MRLVPDKREILEFVPGDRARLAPDDESRESAMAGFVDDLRKVTLLLKAPKAVVGAAR